MILAVCLVLWSVMVQGAVLMNMPQREIAIFPIRARLAGSAPFMLVRTGGIGSVVGTGARGQTYGSQGIQNSYGGQVTGAQTGYGNPAGSGYTQTSLPSPGGYGSFIAAGSHGGSGRVQTGYGTRSSMTGYGGRTNQGRSYGNQGVQTGYGNSGSQVPCPNNCCDRHADCSSLANQGRCVQSYFQMYAQCSMACGFCAPTGHAHGNNVGGYGRKK